MKTKACDDLNTDLLKIDKNVNYKKFYEQLCSYGLLPQLFNRLEYLTPQLWITSSQII